MYSIRYVSQKTGLSSHTLRFYEKEGLLKNVGRSQGGFRQYTDEDLEALGLICCLKNTGMSLQEITRFVTLGCSRFLDGVYIFPGFSPRASSCSLVSCAFLI